MEIRCIEISARKGYGKASQICPHHSSIICNCFIGLSLSSLRFFAVTSINLTILKGGVEYNVIPAEMSATINLRFSIDTDLDAFERQVKYKFLKLSSKVLKKIHMIT